MFVLILDMNYYCNNCKCDISFEVYEFSTKSKKFGKALCRFCQNKLTQETNPQPTSLARVLYDALKRQGIPATLEKFDGFKHIDIAIPKYQVNIEVDGGHHNLTSKQALADLKRTYYSFKKGYVTLRIPNSLVRDELEQTAKYIARFIKESKEQLEEEYEAELF